MFWLIISLVIFHGLHSIRMLAPEWRTRKIAEIGENKWKGLYSLISLLALVFLVWAYSVASSDYIEVYNPPLWGRHLAVLIMLLAFIALMVFNLKPGRLKPILKHPMLLSIKLWAVAHLLANGDLASVLLFGSFLAWAVWNRISVKRRNEPLPGAGPIINDLIAIISGTVLWGLFIWVAHEWLFGVPLVS